MVREISIRIDKLMEEIIAKFSDEQQQEQSDIIRELITSGSIYLAIKGFIKG